MLYVSGLSATLRNELFVSLIENFLFDDQSTNEVSC